MMKSIKNIGPLFLALSLFWNVFSTSESAHALWGFGSKKPVVLSRNLSEGGYTFLHRVFQTQIKKKDFVRIQTGDCIFTYKYNPSHTSFSQGLSLIKGDRTGETYKIFSQVSGNFDLNTAKIQARANRSLLQKILRRSYP